MGEPGFSPRLRPELLGLRKRGNGLPSAPTLESLGNGFREFRTGVKAELRRAERGCGDPEGDTFRFRVEAGSLLAKSLGLWLT